MTFEEFARMHPEAVTATHMGQLPDLGEVVVGRDYPGEGFAVIRCGNTEVRVGYSLLCHLALKVDGDSPASAELQDLQRALWSITAEASLGRSAPTS